jgi:ferritin
MSKSKKTSGKLSKTKLVSDKSVKLLQQRIQQEELSSRIYLSMSMWLDNSGFTNAAKLWKKYANEENEHADWSRDYLLSFGILPETPELEKISIKYQGLPDIIVKTFNHEICITQQIEMLAKHAMSVGDHMLYTLAAKFLKEQVDEHAKTQNLVDQINTFGTDKQSLRLLDNYIKDLL